MDQGTCNCGMTFQINPVGRRRKFCSTKCKERTSNARARQSVCRSCGQTFEHVRGQVRFCPNCRYVARELPKHGREVQIVGGLESLRCSKCDKVKSVGDFPPARGGVEGRASWCRACYHDYNMARADTTLKQSRRSKYGISIEDQDALWAEQEGACAACKRPFTRLGEAHLDHCHTTGRVRGFLCGPCNHALGRCGDDIDRLVALGEYLHRTR